MNQSHRQPSAVANLIVNCDESRHLTQLLMEFAGDHMNVDPDRVHWGHAGDAASLRAELSELVTRFGLEP